MSGHEIWHDEEMGTVVLNASDLATSEIMSALGDQHPEMAAMVRWGANATRRGNLFERDKFVTPDKIFDQMTVAQEAESDDIVAGVLESTEALAFGTMTVESFDEDEEDVWNQITDDLDLDSRIREMWRELFIVSQVYVAAWWSTKSYRVRGRSKNGVKRKKEFRNLRVPTAITILDPMKIVPVGNFMFNQEGLAWIASRSEGQDFDRALQNTTTGDDETVRRLIKERYTPDRSEQKRLSALGVDHRNLFLLDPKNVWRHTATRPQYRPFASVRMKSVFELLDIKHLLREMDRTNLLASTNFIVLVKKGTDDKPAKQSEIDNLNAQVRTLARVPVIVGDHRLSIEIITPQQDNTLKPERYNLLDARIASRLYMMFVTGSSGSGGGGKDDSIKLSRVVARGMESRRMLLRKSIERNILLPVYDRNVAFTERPEISFHPKQIALDFDPGLASFFLDLRDRREISRATLLEQIDLDQDNEALKREREADYFDEVFKTISGLNDPLLQPKTSPADKGGVDPKAAGRTKGGNRNGGGAAPGTGQGQEPDPRRKPKST